MTSITPIKLCWQVSPAPTGRYRSFSKRDWPYASYNVKNGLPAFRIDCTVKDFSYRPDQVKMANHPALELWVADWNIENPEVNGAFKWRCLKKRFNTVEEAKVGADEFIKTHHSFLPREFRQNEDTE